MACVTRFRVPTKYGNVKTTVDGEKFDSAAEARRYQVLKIMERAKEITDLKRQVRYPLVAHAVEPVAVAFYVADFVYRRVSDGVEVVEDCKGFRTDMYKLKRKWMKACYGIDILETK